jgi:hypothetical protein
VVVTAQQADSAIRTSLRHSCPASPCTIKVSRKSEMTGSQAGSCGSVSTGNRRRPWLSS